MTQRTIHNTKTPDFELNIILRWNFGAASLWKVMVWNTSCYSAKKGYLTDKGMIMADDVICLHKVSYSFFFSFFCHKSWRCKLFHFLPYLSLLLVNEFKVELLGKDFLVSKRGFLWPFCPFAFALPGSRVSVLGWKTHPWPRDMKI